MTALVSILIPAYNAQRWLGQSVESALAQQWPHKEIIVVDDGSTDETRSIARSYAPRGVRLVTQRNAGAARARNVAWSLAQGDFIQWLDADDLLHPRKIEHQMAQLASNGAERKLLATCAWGRFFRAPERAAFRPDALWQTLAPADWICAKFNRNAFMFPATWLVSRALIDAAGGWDEHLSLDDDGEYLCRLIRHCDRVEFAADARCYYRIGNTSSLSWQKSDKALASVFESMTLCISYLLSLEDSARTRAACLRFVQDNFGQFYPEHTGLSERCRNLAHSLGGTVQAPQERSHFKLFRTMFGWQAAKATRSRIDHSRLMAAKLLENLGAMRQGAPPRA
jgi:glycosyltransferase involved in cell wall biosynthesis